ncbi:Membrane-associated guanylate kinase, WW and PDZ domain-containing protein 2 [Cichlidogyrus casuarinus]|uniref:Membrane-associated guanylate kinase, WW and PDZ domain-containing protein 2 n=1 Tax=Cichlidogyrus casuarinus TaxID=1844966 RepID=A0ABD2PLY6_9PLAT
MTNGQPLAKMVTLTTDASRGGFFGFSFRGGREVNQPISILSVAKNGAAFLDGRVSVGDLVLRINDVSTRGLTQKEAINLVKCRGRNVNLVLQSSAASAQPQPPLPPEKKPRKLK